MSPMLTGLVELEMIPFSSFTSRVAAISVNTPFPTSTNSTRSPLSMFSFSRTSFGMVIRPLLVRMAAAMAMTYTASGSVPAGTAFNAS